MNKIDSNNTQPLDSLFHPEAVAIVGVSNSPSNPVRICYLESIQKFGYKGTIYLVNPNESSIMGLKCYPSIKDIPGPVDLVIVGIAARFCLGLLQECVEKGVKYVSFFTSGFSETGDEEGKRLEMEVLQIAKEGGIRILGPNCMGVYAPAQGLSFSSDFPVQSGPLGFISQSGGNATYVVRAGAAVDIHFSKLVSYGNACDINESDILEYLSRDPETHIIGAYIEGVRDGRRFLRVLGEAARIKPVVLLKGGASEAGALTAVSHTSALAGSGQAWEAILRQANVIRVDSLDELIDVTLLLSHMPSPRGPNVGIVGIGGGASVLAADLCVKQGLTLPILPDDIKQELIKIAPVAGNIYTNPIDASQIVFHEKNFRRAVRLQAEWEEVDALILSLEMDMIGFPYDMRVPMIKEVVENMIKAAGETKKPIAIVTHACFTIRSITLQHELHRRCVEAGIPHFTSMERLVKALSKVIQYFETKKNSGSSAECVGD